MPRFTKDKPATPLPWHLTVLRHTDVIVIAATAVGVMHLRTSHALFYSLSSTATSFSAKGLKRVIKQPRPEGSYNKRTHGMPSTHSASITFMGLYLALSFLLLPLHPSVPVPAALVKPGPPSAASEWSDLPARAAYALVSLTFPAVVIWSRVALGLHTPAQCAAGAMLGATNAVTLFTAWNGLQAWGVSTASTLLQPGSGSWLQSGLGSSLGVWADGWLKALEDEARSRWLS